MKRKYIYVGLLLIILQVIYFVFFTYPNAHKENFKKVNENGNIHIIDKQKMYNFYKENPEINTIFKKQKGDDLKLDTLLDTYQKFESKNNLSEEEKFFFKNIIYSTFITVEPVKVIDFAINESNNMKLTEDARAEATFLLANTIFLNYDKADIIISYIEKVPPYAGMLTNLKTTEEKIETLNNTSFSIYPNFSNSSLKLFLMTKKYQNMKDSDEKNRLKDELINFYNSIKDTNFSFIADKNENKLKFSIIRFYFTSSYYTLLDLKLIDKYNDETVNIIREQFMKQTGDKIIYIDEIINGDFNLVSWLKYSRALSFKSGAYEGNVEYIPSYLKYIKTNSLYTIIKKSPYFKSDLEYFKEVDPTF